MVCVEERFQLCDGRYESLLRQKRNVSGLGCLSEQATQDETEKRKELLRIKISGERTAKRCSMSLKRVSEAEPMDVALAARSRFQATSEIRFGVSFDVVGNVFT